MLVVNLLKLIKVLDYIEKYHYSYKMHTEKTSKGYDIRILSLNVSNPSVARSNDKADALNVNNK